MGETLRRTNERDMLHVTLHTAEILLYIAEVLLSSPP
jgi:hypothetical protein